MTGKRGRWGTRSGQSSRSSRSAPRGRARCNSALCPRGDGVALALDLPGMLADECTRLLACTERALTEASPGLGDWLPGGAAVPVVCLHQPDEHPGLPLAVARAGRCAHRPHRRRRTPPRRRRRRPRSGAGRLGPPPLGRRPAGARHRRARLAPRGHPPSGTRRRRRRAPGRCGAPPSEAAPALSAPTSPGLPPRAARAVLIRCTAPATLTPAHATGGPSP